MNSTDKELEELASMTDKNKSVLKTSEHVGSHDAGNVDLVFTSIETDGSADSIEYEPVDNAESYQTYTEQIVFKTYDEDSLPHRFNARFEV